MTEEQRKRDLALVAALIERAEDEENLQLRMFVGADSREDAEALGRQLPAMLAALRFVEEHGETLGFALGFAECSPENTETLTSELIAALRALAALRVRPSDSREGEP